METKEVKQLYKYRERLPGRRKDRCTEPGWRPWDLRTTGWLVWLQQNEPGDSGQGGDGKGRGGEAWPEDSEGLDFILRRTGRDGEEVVPKASR